jgi:hypothetical protein
MAAGMDGMFINQPKANPVKKLQEDNKWLTSRVRVLESELRHAQKVASDRHSLLQDSRRALDHVMAEAQRITNKLEGAGFYEMKQ